MAIAVTERRRLLLLMMFAVFCTHRWINGGTFLLLLVLHLNEFAPPQRHFVSSKNKKYRVCVLSKRQSLSLVISYVFLIY